MTKGVETATITCPVCGLVGHLQRTEGNPVMNAFADRNEFKRLCKDAGEFYVLDCPHWDVAQIAAHAQLTQQTKHRGHGAGPSPVARPIAAPRGHRSR